MNDSLFPTYDLERHLLTSFLTSTLRKINELAEEVERLRSAVGQRGPEASNNSIQSGSSGPPSNHINGSDQQVPVFPLQPPSLPQQSNLPAQFQSPSTPIISSAPVSFSAPPPRGYSRSLEYINLDRDRINDLFRMWKAINEVSIIEIVWPS